jgi:serine/threonine protein kinase
MLVGLPPFIDESNDKLYKKIKYTDPSFDYKFLSDKAIDICKKLLEKDPLKRLGS